MEEKGRRQRFWSWLTNKYQLIIRNEENFAERTTISFNYAKAALVLVVVFTLLFIASLFLSRTVLSKWFDPEHVNRNQMREIKELQQSLDELESMYHNQNEMLRSVQTAFAGGEAIDDSVDLSETSTDAIQEEELPAIDSIFRAQFESSSASLVSNEWLGGYEEITDMYFISPIAKRDVIQSEAGDISRKYDFKEGHFGIDVLAKDETPIKAVTDGTVISAAWTSDFGYVIGVQHKNSVISFYKHNATILKKVGDYVKTGDILAIIGNTGELTSGTHLHFELWYKGKPVDPEYFITF